MKMRAVKCKSVSKGIPEFMFQFPTCETVAEFIATYTEEVVYAWILAKLDVMAQAFARAFAEQQGVNATIERMETWQPGQRIASTETMKVVAANAANAAERAMHEAIAQKVAMGLIERDVAIALGVPESML
jgi:hypothetical protein